MQKRDGRETVHHSSWIRTTELLEESVWRAGLASRNWRCERWN